MRAFPMKSQCGQAMTEFVAAMALFLPLILGVIYAFKYGDVKHQAIQASRYAAMERALDPRAHESDTVIRDETVSRFFRDGAQHNIALNEQPTGTTAGDENPNWDQLNGNPMLGPNYGGITVTLTSKNVDSALLAPVNFATHGFNRLNGGYGTQADVEVPLANVAHFAPLANLNLTIGASTVIAGDPWNGGGAADVAGHFTPLSVPGRALSALTSVMNLLSNIPGIDPFEMLAGTPPPQFGCIKPDVVTQDATNSMAVYNSQDDPRNPSNPNDQCY
jgi:hypothetical protein